MCKWYVHNMQNKCKLWPHRWWKDNNTVVAPFSLLVDRFHSVCRMVHASVGHDKFCMVKGAKVQTQVCTNACRYNT